MELAASVPNPACDLELPGGSRLSSHFPGRYCVLGPEAKADVGNRQGGLLLLLSLLGYSTTGLRSTT